ncbi:MAG: DUF4105 domain-containing protein [Prevotella sp.]|nr:DUF4105 domain-containing protein [Prevotella sp.]
MAIAASLPTAAIATPIFKGAEKEAEKEATQTRLTASIITCYPGAEIYELCGHSALRIRGVANNGEEIDSVWNYGVFDFNEPNFIGRFVKGETDYMLAGYPFSWFMPEYVHTGRRVVEQDLNLSDEQVRKLRKLLQIEQMPQNRKYRYNYVRDNCSTRIIDRLRQATSDSILLADSVRYSSFREVMRAYHRNYPWYQFGIDLALGQGIDAKLQRDQQLFAPMEMMTDVRNAKLRDGRPLVKSERLLNEGTPEASDGPTPWYLTPMAASIALLLLTITVCIIDIRHKRISRWLWAVYYGLAGLGGCLIYYLVFESSHDSTSPNHLIFWLNPLQLLILAGLWSRVGRKIVSILSWGNIAVTGLLLISWPFQPQSANIAVFPLMAANILLSGTWVYVHAIKGGENSYNNSGKAKRETAKKPPQKRKSTKKKSGKR